MLFYQASLLVSNDVSVFSRYLEHPHAEPEYREGRATTPSAPPCAAKGTTWIRGASSPRSRRSPSAISPSYADRFPRRGRRSSICQWTSVHQSTRSSGIETDINARSDEENRRSIAGTTRPARAAGSDSELPKKIPRSTGSSGGPSDQRSSARRADQATPRVESQEQVPVVPGRACGPDARTGRSPSAAGRLGGAARMHRRAGTGPAREGEALWPTRTRARRRPPAAELRSPPRSSRGRAGRGGGRCVPRRDRSTPPVAVTTARGIQRRANLLPLVGSRIRSAARRVPCAIRAVRVRGGGSRRSGARHHAPRNARDASRARRAARAVNGSAPLAPRPPGRAFHRGQGRPGLHHRVRARRSTRSGSRFSPIATRHSSPWSSRQPAISPTAARPPWRRALASGGSVSSAGPGEGSLALHGAGLEPLVHGFRFGDDGLTFDGSIVVTGSSARHPDGRALAGSVSTGCRPGAGRSISLSGKDTRRSVSSRPGKPTQRSMRRRTVRDS